MGLRIAALNFTKRIFRRLQHVVVDDLLVAVIKFDDGDTVLVVN